MPKGIFPILKIEQRVALHRHKHAASYDEPKYFGASEDFVSFVCALIIKADIDWRAQQDEDTKICLDSPAFLTQRYRFKKLCLLELKKILNKEFVSICAAKDVNVHVLSCDQAYICYSWEVHG